MCRAARTDRQSRRDMNCTQPPPRTNTQCACSKLYQAYALQVTAVSRHRILAAHLGAKLTIIYRMLHQVRKTFAITFRQNAGQKLRSDLCGYLTKSVNVAKVSQQQNNNNNNEKNAQRRRIHCVLAVVRQSQNFFTNPFPDGQNLISWRWSLPLPTNPVWWGSMHAISSYRGNRPTNTRRPSIANTQTGPITIHCATKLSTQCNIASLAEVMTMHAPRCIWLHLAVLDLNNTDVNSLRHSIYKVQCTVSRSV